ERDDGYMDISSGPDFYFTEYETWPDSSKEALKHARGRILDVGCGAGRHCLYFQSLGHEIVGIDNSPLAVEVCRRRGVKEARVLSASQVTKKLGLFDTIIMCGNNLALLESQDRAPQMLKRFHPITNKDAIIIGQIRDPYLTDNPVHLNYHAYNLSRGRMPGQVRIRVRHQLFKSPWFDYLFLSREELKELLIGTGWRVRQFVDQYIEEEGGMYWAVLEKD
ncbi:MAG: class I SAM-dependent methyltransferase, partial [Calditrichota bacterium]